MNVYSVKPDYVFNADEGKAEAQQAMLDELGLAFGPGHTVFCTADQALALVAKGFCGQYFNSDALKLVYDTAENNSNELVKAALATVKEVSLAFNDRCNQVQPSAGLLNIRHTQVFEDCCTDVLQRQLDNGWVILAIQPQPDQRRPDYILGRY